MFEKIHKGSSQVAWILTTVSQRVQCPGGTHPPNEVISPSDSFRKPGDPSPGPQQVVGKRKKAQGGSGPAGCHPTSVPASSSPAEPDGFPGAVSQCSLQWVACDTVVTMTDLSSSFSVVMGADNSEPVNLSLWPAPPSALNRNALPGSRLVSVRRKEPVSLMGLTPALPCPPASGFPLVTRKHPFGEYYRSSF